MSESRKMGSMLLVLLLSLVQNWRLIRSFLRSEGAPMCLYCFLFAFVSIPPFIPQNMWLPVHVRVQFTSCSLCHQAYFEHGIVPYSG